MFRGFLADFAGGWRVFAEFRGRVAIIRGFLTISQNFSKFRVRRTRTRKIRRPPTILLGIPSIFRRLSVKPQENIGKFPNFHEFHWFYKDFMRTRN